MEIWITIIIKKILKIINIKKSENYQSKFYGKNVVILGTIINYPNRDSLINILEHYGASVKAKISKTTDIVIYGVGAGDVTLEKAYNLNSLGHNIDIIDELSFYEYMESIGEVGNGTITMRKVTPSNDEILRMEEEISKQILINRCSNSIVENQSFTGRNVVVIGDFSQFSDNNDLIYSLKKQGAIIHNEISSALDLAICGVNLNWDKISRIEEFIKDGYNIEFIDESILSSCFQAIELRSKGRDMTMGVSCKGIRRVIYAEINNACTIEKSGQINEAIAIYRQLITASHKLETPFERLCIIHRRLKQFDDELNVIERWENLLKDNTINYNRISLEDLHKRKLKCLALKSKYLEIQKVSLHL